MVPHPPYSPDLAPCDFSIFPLLKSKLRGQRFTLRELEDVTSKELRSWNQDIFRKAIDKLPLRWGKCVQAEGDFFEGQHIQLPSDTEDSAAETSGNETDNEDPATD